MPLRVEDMRDGIICGCDRCGAGYHFQRATSTLLTGSDSNRLSFWAVCESCSNRNRNTTRPQWVEDFERQIAESRNYASGNGLRGMHHYRMYTVRGSLVDYDIRRRQFEITYADGRRIYCTLDNAPDDV